MSLPWWCYLWRTWSYHWQICSRDAPCWLSKEVAMSAKSTWQGIWATSGGGRQPPAESGQETALGFAFMKKQILPTTWACLKVHSSPLTYFTLYYSLEVHPLLYKWLHFVPFYGWVICHGIWVLHLLYPFICGWTFRLIPCPGCCQ